MAPKGTGFPKRARLLKGRDFDRVFARPRRSVDDCFTVLARNNGSDEARLGLAIARKHARRAVDRNRLKRLVRESFRHHRHELAGLDLVVLGRHAACTRDNVALTASLERHWNRLLGQCRPSSSS